MKSKKPIESLILNLRGQKVILDADLAELYDVPTKCLNEAVKRNVDRFPDDFLIRLATAEKAEVVANCDPLVRLKFSPQLPWAFTEHGAAGARSAPASRIKLILPSALNLSKALGLEV